MLKNKNIEITNFYRYTLAGLLILGVIVATVIVMWRNVRSIEQLREQEHARLMDNIASTAGFYFAEGRYDYISSMMALLAQVSFIKSVAIFQNQRAFLQVGQEKLNYEQAAVANRAQLDARKQRLIITRALSAPGAKASVMAVSFSLQELQRLVQQIVYAFSVIAALLFLLSILGTRLLWLEKNKRTMVRQITHDAGQQLKIIRYKLEKIAARKNAAGREKHLKCALESADSIQSAMDNLSDQMYLSQDRIQLKPKHANIVQKLQAVLLGFEEKIAQRQMRLIFSPPAEQIWVQADPEVIRRVTMNLIDNAIKYSPPRTCITLGVQQLDQMVGVRIADQGDGIALGIRRKIFKAYWQLNPNSPGLGLGLSTARQLIRLSGGELSLESSQPGKGAVFCFTLPAAEGNHEEKNDC